MKRTRRFLSVLFLLALFCAVSASASGTERAAGDVKTSLTVTFRDGGETLSTYNIAAGDRPFFVPPLDSHGESIRGWITGGRRIIRPSDVPLTQDTVYDVWRAPRLNTESHRSYISGRGGAVFAPWDALTRGEAAMIVASLLADPNEYGPVRISFSDVEEGAWYSEPILRLCSLGILNGYADGTFRPDDTITRAEFVTILAPFFDLSEGGIHFFDVPSTHWASESILSASEKEWINGYEDGSFRPDQGISRAEAVTIMNGALSRDISGEETQAMIHSSNISPFVDVRTTDWFYGAVIESAVSHDYDRISGIERWLSFTYKSCGYEPGLHWIEDRFYFVDQNHQISFLSPGIQWLGEEIYLVDDNGDIVTEPGFLMDGLELYYIQEGGPFARDMEIGSLYFDGEGKYTCGNAYLDQLVKDTLSSCTDESMSQAQKLRAGYLWLRENCRYLNRAHHKRGTTYWTEESATWMLTNRRGNCYCFAGAFYYMARQLGYEAQAISGGLGRSNSDHAWVMIDGRIYDPELEYAYLYRFSTSRYYNLYGITRSAAPFVYVFPR